MNTASLLQFLFSGLMVGTIYALVAPDGYARPRGRAQIMRLLVTLRAAGTTILLVEQNARPALRFADRAYVLEVGRVALSGASADLLADDQLKAARLGG